MRIPAHERAQKNAKDNNGDAAEQEMKENAARSLARSIALDYVKLEISSGALSLIVL